MEKENQKRYHCAMSSVIPVFLRRAWHSMKEEIGLASYMKPQSYRVTYRVTLFNCSAEQQSRTLVLPVPRTVSSQTVRTEAQFTPEAVLQTESRFGNLYALWHFSLAPQETAVFEEGIEVEVRPSGATPSPLWGDSPFKKGEKNARLQVRDNRFIQPSNLHIRALVKQIAGNERDPFLLVKRFNYYTVSHLAYGDPIDGLYSASDVLSRSRVDCGGFSTFFLSLCAAAGIPGRLLCGFWAGPTENEMHAWAEVQMPDGTWMPADPSVEYLFRSGRTDRAGRLGFVGSDRVILSVGCDMELLIDGQIVPADILQTPLIYPKEAAAGLRVTRDFITIPS